MVPSQLRILNLSGNSLQDEGGLAVASGLAGNGSLQQLDLTDCAIGAAGLAALMNAAHNNMLLQVLLLSKNCCEQSIEPMVSPSCSSSVSPSPFIWRCSWSHCCKTTEKFVD